MELSSETRRTRWIALLLAIVVGAGLLGVHASLIGDYLSLVGKLGLRGALAAPTPFKQAYPAFAADAQTWVRHATSLLEGQGPRLRHTNIDNAPKGREVHWNTAWGWTIATAGWLDHKLTGAPLLIAIERSTGWLNSVVLLALTIVLATWTARRAGAAAGVVVVFAMVGHPRIYEGFFPSYVDHHGLLSVAVLGMMLGATFMGSGWWRPLPADLRMQLLPVSPESAKSAAVFSALCGVFGMWVSAASVIAPIAIVGLIGFLVVALRGRDAQAAGERFDPQVWRVWGRVGAVGSLFFYLVEYFPNHLGLRLESNHPFYALAWWGGGELVAQIGERWLGSKAQRWNGLHRLSAPLMAVLIAPATIALGGPAVFVVMDPFLSRLHSEHIQEFLPLWRSLQAGGWKVVSSVVGFENVPLLVGIIVLARMRRRAPLLIWFGTIAAVVFTAMAWMQARWLLNASGSQVALALVLIAYFFGERTQRIRWIGAVAAASLVFLPNAVTRITGGMADLRERKVTPKDAQAALARDIAATIRASQPEGEIVLLTSPNSSTAIGYYGRFKTLGTLYWENVEGLKSAAAILAATSNEEAAKLIRKLGVTHIAMVSEENFVGPYYMLLHPGAKLEDTTKAFGYQLLVDRVVPPWLRMLPYSIPEDLKTLNPTVLLFKVAFEQTSADALYYVALAKVALGAMAEAEKDFDTLIQSSPDSFQPYLHKGELLFARQEWEASAETTLAGIRRAPPERRLDLYAGAAGNLFRNRQHALAVRIYEVALAESSNAHIAAFLAFALATSPDDAVRNGARALTIAEAAVKADPNSTTVLNSLAVAQAEVGRFADAIATTERALTIAREQKHAEAIKVSESRLAAFKAGKPWRE